MPALDSRTLRNNRPMYTIAVAQTVVVVVLYLASLGLPAFGVWRAWRSSWETLERLEFEENTRNKIMRSPMPDEEKAAELAWSGVRSTTWNDIGNMAVEIEYAIVKNVRDDLRGPGLLVLAGVVCGTVASIWAVFLPAL